MHYYKRNIGDYYKKAGRLTMLQHGAYTLLQDACYDREAFPTLDDAIEWTWASTPEEIQAVEFVLKKFFDEKDGVFVQKRISEEVEKYQSNAATNKRIAIEREAKRKESKTDGERTEHEPCTHEHEAPPNHKPRTINQEPLTNNHKQVKKDSPSAQSSWGKKRFANELVKLGANPAHVDDWMKTRKTATETAFNGFIEQVGISGLTVSEAVKIAAESGWQGFKAEWVANRRLSPISSAKPVNQYNKYNPDPNQPKAIEGELL